MVSRKPESIAQLIRDLQTSNWHALRVLSGALNELPTEILSPLVPGKPLEWLQTPYARLGAVEIHAMELSDDW